MYEIGFEERFLAWHIMPGVEGPEGQLHSHDYRMQVVIERDALDDRGMVCDLDLLQESLADVVSTVRGGNLDVILRPGQDAVTVETLARWAHGELERRLRLPDGRLSVRVWESAVAFGGYSATLGFHER